MWESGLIFIWNTAKNYVFRRRPLFGKKVGLSRWAGLMSVGALFSWLYYECGLQGNQDWLQILLTPVWESGLIFIWKKLKIAFFAKDLYVGKNDRFDLLGWLNECWDPFLIIIILMWTSRQWKVPIICSWLFSESVFPLVSMMKHLCLKTEWFDVCDCATMTVVPLLTWKPLLIAY